MTTQQTPCDSDRIEAFLKGELSEVQLADFEDHLSVCTNCDSELTQRTADGAFWTDAKQFLRSAEDVEATRDMDHDATVRSDLGFLDPTDDPHMLGRFGGYEISGVIGRGGMGVVMKGWDVSLDRFVAIKVLHPAYAGQSASRKRFAREAQAAAAVLHDNVIPIYGVDHWNDMPYLVMPYIKGESLQQRIDRSAPLALEDILGISLQIARGLAAAHDQGLVHRDIKPANILMPASVSRVIITDFGLARTADDASLTRSGVLAGTPQYMSPEQAKGEAIDGRTDLFSLGSVMYAMACGRPPFRAETPYGVLRKLTDDPHRPLSQVREDTPAWFGPIVDRLLDKDPVKRFQSATELAVHLEDCLAHIRQPSTTLLPKLKPPKKRSLASRWPLAAALVCLSLVAFALSQIEWGRNSIESNDRPAERIGTHAGTASENSSPDNPAHQSDTVNAVGPSSVLDSGGPPGHLGWEYDDSQLQRLETDLHLLLYDTATDPYPDTSQSPE